MNAFRTLIEKNVFGVCSYLGERMGISGTRVRLYFMYLSFVTLGSPILVYLILAFWLNFRRYLRKGYDLIMR